MHSTQLTSTLKGVHQIISTLCNVEKEVGVVCVWVNLSLISRLTQEIQSLKFNVLLLLAFYFSYEIGLWLVKLKFKIC